MDRLRDIPVEDVDELKARLAEAEETLRAIRAGEVDALVVATDDGDRVFTLRGADEPYRILLEQMSEGAASLSIDGTVLYANRRLADMLAVGLPELIGSSMSAWIAESDRPVLRGLLAPSPRREGAPPHAPTAMRRVGDVSFVSRGGAAVEVSLSITPLPPEAGPAWSLVATDISEHVRTETELDARVRSRTRDLEASNRELEAFSYSVSHDLRAPLQTIDGFSQLVLEREQEKLDEKSVHQLERVCGASRQMGVLIDELLALSRLARWEMHPRRVDLSALAEEAVHEQRAAHPEWTGEVQIEPGIAIVAERELLRSALVNLIANAFKFTAERDDALIEFGSIRRHDERVLFVRDNGVGFDMRYAAKLFQPFGRLHDAKRFPGTGVGLATVQRIVRRHGGHVWAEGEPGKGATFYFTVGSLEAEDPPAAGAS